VQEPLSAPRQRQTRSEADRGVPQERSEVRVEEAQVGKRVAVRWPLQRAECLGIEGTITRAWGGNHRYSALDVLLDEGDTHLFWQHELEEIIARA